MKVQKDKSRTLGSRRSWVHCCVVAIHLLAAPEEGKWRPTEDKNSSYPILSTCIRLERAASALNERHGIRPTAADESGNNSRAITCEDVLLSYKRYHYFESLTGCADLVSVANLQRSLRQFHRIATQSVLRTAEDETRVTRVLRVCSPVRFSARECCGLSSASFCIWCCPIFRLNVKVSEQPCVAFMVNCCMKGHTATSLRGWCTGIMVL